MTKAANFPPELMFLKSVTSNRSEEYRAAWWLKSQFEDLEWELNFGDTSHTVSFRVYLNDQSLLTSSKNRALLTVFKYWLCIQTHSDVTGARPLSKIPSRQAVSRVFRLIDYLLLHSARYDLAKFGLLAMSEGDFLSILASLAASGDTSQSLYNWNHRVSEYLKSQLNYVTPSELAALQSSIPELFEIDIPRSERDLGLDDGDLIRARAFLWLQGSYQTCRSNSAYRYRPVQRILLERVLPNTIWSIHTTFPIIEDLCVGRIERYFREFDSAPIRTANDDSLSELGLAYWSATIRTLGLLDELNEPVPVSSLDKICSRSIAECTPLKRLGRFRTLPQEWAFRALRQSVEFTLEYGDEIVDSYLRIARAAHDSGQTVTRYSRRNGIHHLLTPKLRDLGVSVWSVTSEMALSESNPMRNAPRGSATEYFVRFRLGEGLAEMIRVLYGAIQICVGALSARRQGELLDLQVGDALDPEGRYLIFANRKTGILGKREVEARPIPPVCARMIGLLEKMQTDLVAYGVLEKVQEVFAQPGRKTVSFCLTHSLYNSALDAFCDYFEGPLDEHGNRFYIRQHQLRRFFAMLFFWGRAYGGLETLRWFLGHTDVEHVYHYITESTPGAILRAAKAGFGAEALRNAEKNFEELGDLVAQHFGTRNFSVLDSSELEEYIEELLERKTVEIEPHFIKSSEGKTFQVIVKILWGKYEN